MHQPVLVEEVLSSLSIRKDGCYIDGTAGSGGHARAILSALGSEGRLLAIDRDAEAVARVEAALHGDARVRIINGNFGDVEQLALAHGWKSVDGVLLDVGVSSEQLDTGERGFSFEHNGPLDMRMNQQEGRMAADLVNESDETELVDLIRTYGEEKQARRIARAIVRAREKKRFDTTRELSDVVAAAVGGRRGRLNPATRTFQALRIAVNGELDALERGLEAGVGLLRSGGRMAVISFHSLEDRAVKRCMREHAGRWVSLQSGGQEWQGRRPTVALVNRKPIQAGPDEVTRNPRARSAKLRVVERCPEGEPL